CGGCSDGLEGGFLEKGGARLFSSDGATARYIEFADATIPGYPYAFHVLRSQFDQLLLESARKRGAEVQEEPTVMEARASHREGCELTVKQPGGGISRHRARFLLDASGRDALVDS